MAIGQFYAKVFCYVSTLSGTVACEPGDRLPDDASSHDVDRLLRAGAIRFEPTVDLEAMTIAQLKDYADQHEIDLGDASRKADIVAVIVASTEG